MEAQKVATENKTASLKHEVVSELREDLQEVNIKFIECVRYKPSIDMYCAADIMESEGKSISEWLGNSRSQNIRHNYPEWFSFINLGRGKKALFVKYEMIQFLLSWIDDSLGADFVYGTQRSKLRRYGYIYLVQYPEDIKQHVIKVGRTFNIRKRYQNKVDVIAIEYVNDMFNEEKKLIETFTKKYGEPVRGNEYFRCFRIEDAVKTFYDFVYEIHND